ncbi:MAG TPA: methyltransferase domain-containing protein [Candidatus Acidoferrales bacterium]|nr:methyltransferase domain-containing protein [Candidatus Acidoferrales bacterium]
MATSSSTSCVSPSYGYQLWAGSYDRESNPMLSLERRILEPLLPRIEGLDLVDIGCGTGRWLDALKGKGVRSLRGIDLSREMLNHARAKLGDAATFVCADYVDVPLDEASADVILCNFVLSYVADPVVLLNAVRKTLRPGGSLFLSDVHPETARKWNWRRGIREQSEFREIRTHYRTIEEIINMCSDTGLIVRLHLEPQFGRQERTIFEEHGKLTYFNEIRSYPPIYLLQLTTPVKRKRLVPAPDRTGSITGVRRGRLALGPDAAVRGEIGILDARVQSIRDAVSGGPSSRSESCIDLSGYLVLPGLINAHDHLEFALFPRLGKGNYANFLDWAEDIHRTHACEIALHRQIPKDVRLWWGGIRNLLCGVTTVCHHNPYDTEVFDQDFVVRVLKDFGWAHSLRLEPGAALKKLETPEGRRFFIHLAEGVDGRSSEEIFALDRTGALDPNTVIIHGLGMDAKGGTLLRAAGAGLVWCPSSNLFLFGKTMPFDEIRRFPTVALGSDSPLTARGDLLDEVRCAQQVLRTPSAHVYDYVTDQAARLMGLKNGEGALRVGGFADLIAARDVGLTPAETLPALSYQDVQLVVLGGRVQLASPEIKQSLSKNAVKGLQPLSVEGTTRWIRAPLNFLFEQTVRYLSGPIYLGGKVVRLGG